MDNQITILGTGNAQATHCYNTCFVVRSSGGHLLLVDAGGGNGILLQLEKAGFDWRDIHDLYVTHAHTDHILGVVWMMRMALQKQNHLRIYSHRKVLDILVYLSQQLLPRKQSDRMGTIVEMIEVHDGDHLTIGDMQMQAFDIHSTKEKQFGFAMTLPGGVRLTCLGDEPYSEENERYARGVDWLMSEAFCVYDDRERFKPYEKHHSTAIDAARLAQQLNVRNLILYHTEDKTLDTRRQRYAAEAQSAFDGRVIVPDDLEVIVLE